MSFDLSNLALKDTTTLHLLHPVTQDKLYADDEEKKPVTIELYGTSSKQYRNATNAMQNRQLARQRKKESIKADELREEAVKLLVACSASATNLAIDGEEVGNEASFRKLYSDPRFSWVKDQVDEALGDVSRFLEQ